MNQLARCTCPNPARLSGCCVALRHTQVRHPVQNSTLDLGFDLLLDSIWAYHVGIGVLPFVLATLLIFAIALVTVGGRVYTIATANPVNALRYE